MSSTESDSSYSTSNYYDYRSAAAELEDKLVRHRSCPPPWNTAYDFKTEWENLSRVCGSRTLPNTAFQYIKDALCREYSNEIDFENGLLAALAKALGDDCCSIVDQRERRIIVFTDAAKNWGFATQMTSLDIFASDTENERKDNLAENRSAESPATESRSDSDAASSYRRFDHACVLIQRSNNDDIKVTDVTVAIGLKLSNTSCFRFKVEREDDQDYISTLDLNLASIHGPVTQELCYIIHQVHPSLTRKNIQGVDMPFLVLAGIKEDRRGVDTRLHYVQGGLHVSHNFGEPFKFSIWRSGAFDEIEQAAASYIKTLLYGALLAEKIETTKNDYPSAMLCSSEHKIDGRLIDSCKLIASPIFQKTHFPMVTRVHQGELFRAILSREFLQKDTISRTWVSQEVMKPSACSSYHVVIKVSSMALYKTLVEPLIVSGAFLTLRNSSVLEESVLCVWRPCKISLITAMRDLTELGFCDLKPCLCADLVALWSGFCDLVERVLLPLAHEGVVHCDIRPGWEETYNIMMMQMPEGSISLRLIDFESLAIIGDAEYLPTDYRSFHVQYDMERPNKSALSFLWWQCMLIAYCWLNKVKSRDTNASMFVKDCCCGNIGTHIKSLTDDEILTLSLVAAGSAVSENTIKHHIRDILTPVFKWVDST